MNGCRLLNVSQQSRENTCTGASFLIIMVAACNLSLSLFKKWLQRRCFPGSCPKFLTTAFSTLFEKKHCYKKLGSDIYRKSDYPTFCFNVGLSPLKFFFFICFNDHPSKMMKNAFYFIVKALFVLKIFKF